MTKTEHNNHCQELAINLSNYYSGLYYKDENDDLQLIEDLPGDEQCDVEPVTLWDFFNDVYDIEYTISGDKSFRGVRVMIACGGPNIYINTNTGDIELNWWTESGRYAMDRDVIDAVNDYWEEYYNIL